MDPISALAEKVLAAEVELTNLFQPGKPQPKAGMVARKRQEIADMKQQLVVALEGGSSGEGSSGKASEEERMALLLEVERSVQLQHRAASTSFSESVVGGARSSERSFELFLLEAENQQLRERAENLLHRQQVLEDLAAFHGVIPSSSSSSSASNNNGFVPSSPEGAGSFSASRMAEVDPLEAAAMRSNAMAQ